MSSASRRARATERRSVRKAKAAEKRSNLSAPSSNSVLGNKYKAAQQGGSARGDDFADTEAAGALGDSKQILASSLI